MKVRPDFLKDLCAPPQNKDLSRSVKRGGERRAFGPVAFWRDVSRRRAWKGIFQVVVVSREGKRVDVAGEGILPGIEILFCNRLIIFFQYALHIVPRHARVIPGIPAMPVFPSPLFLFQRSVFSFLFSSYFSLQWVDGT